MINLLRVEIFKRVHISTKEKRYAIKVGGQTLRLSNTSHTRAEIYGNAVKNRYIRLLNAQKKLKENQ